MGLGSEARQTMRAVFLDRDGVINKMHFDPEFGTVDAPSNPAQFTLLCGVGEAIAEFNRLGLLTIVVSNQPGIAKGKFAPAMLKAMDQKMVTAIEAAGGKLDAIYYCLHHPEALLPEYRIICECRKPKPGLLRQAKLDWNIDISRSYMVGDGVTDIAAGRAAGATSLFLSSRKCYNCEIFAAQRSWPDYVVSSLGEAAALIRKLEMGCKEEVYQYEFKCDIL
jgi:D,D-heptose 1,7-bisphosphate phosphatase